MTTAGTRQAASVLVVCAASLVAGSACGSLRREMERAGYVVEREHDFLCRQAFLVFRLPAR